MWAKGPIMGGMRRIPFSEHLLCFSLTTRHIYIFSLHPPNNHKKILSSLLTSDNFGVQGAFIHPCFSKTMSPTMSYTTVVLFEVTGVVLQCVLWFPSRDEVSGAESIFGDTVGGF